MGTILSRARAGAARGATAMALAAGIAAMVPVQGAGASNTGPHMLGTRGAGAASTNSGDLVDHGGPVLAASHTYAIWWGSSSAWSQYVQPGITDLLSNFHGTSFLNIAAQYMPGASINSSFSGSVTDTSAPPSKVSPSTLGAEVSKLLSNHELGGSVDPSGVYFVYTSNFPKGGNFCAWHSYATVDGTKVAVAYMPNTTRVAGCSTGTAYPNSTTDPGLSSLANVTSHEFMESITDTWPASATYAWIDNSGSEIGDKCAWNFIGPVTLADGSVWKLQSEWSNASNDAGTGGCVQS